MDAFDNLIAAVNNAWCTYFQRMSEYNALNMQGNYDANVQVQLYNLWCECSELWKGYTTSLKQLTEFTNWTATVPVVYGEPVGFATASSPVVFMNAFTGYDEETALCRKGDGGQLLMRVGGLPDGTKIFTSNGCYIMLGENVQPEQII